MLSDLWGMVNTIVVPNGDDYNADVGDSSGGIKGEEGMVQANVGQKLVKRNKITSFHQCPKLSSGHCSNKYKHNTTITPPYVILIINPPPIKYILTLVKPFSFV